MQVTAEQIDPCTIALSIDLEEQQVTRTFDSVYREFSRHANVPGFRPGKAPRPILERYLNAERVRERALEKLITDTYPKAIEEEAITPFRQPRIEPTDLKDKQSFTYKAIVPLEPQVTLGEYTGLTVEKPVYKVKDEDVETGITRLREGRARLDRVTDRGVEAGDMLIAELKVDVEGEENSDPPRRQLLQMGNNIPGFDEAVMGLSPGEERTFELTYPDDYEDEEKRGKKAAYHINLSSISAKKLPELNDEFAKEFGVETVDELRSRLREREETNAADVSNQIAESRLIQDIVSKATIFFPDVLVREEVEDELRQLSNELRQHNLPYSAFLAQRGQTPEQHQLGLAEVAAEKVRSILALRQIAQQEGLQVGDAEIDAEFDTLTATGQLSEEQVEEFRTDQRRRLQIANALVQKRLHDFLFESNTINEVEQDTPPSLEEEEELEAEAIEEAAEEITAESAESAEAAEPAEATAIETTEESTTE